METSEAPEAPQNPTIQAGIKSILPSKKTPDPRMWMWIFDHGSYRSVFLFEPVDKDFDYVMYGDYRIKDGIVRVHGELYSKTLLDSKQYQDKEIKYDPLFAATHRIPKEAIYTKKHVTWFWGKLVWQEGGMYIKNVHYVENNSVYRVIYSPNCTVVNDKLPANQQ